MWKTGIRWASVLNTHWKHHMRPKHACCTMPINLVEGDEVCIVAEQQEEVLERFAEEKALHLVPAQRT